MSGKYVFSKALKELRFLHCQTSEHSNAVRYVATGPDSPCDAA
jgi:NADH dehydrogenase (ubiquinone) 1 alpha subcomplex subunit 2